MYIIEKQGLYYRPDNRGYTGLKSEAGRYSFEDAVLTVGPNGPEGPQDGMSMWEEDEAPDYSLSCPWHIRLKYEAYQQGWSDALAQLEKEPTQ